MPPTKAKYTISASGQTPQSDASALNGLRVEIEGSLYELRTAPPNSTLLAASTAPPPYLNLTFSLRAPSGLWNWTLTVISSTPPYSGNWSNTNPATREINEVGSWSSEVINPVEEGEEAAAAS